MDIVGRNWYLILGILVGACSVPIVEAPPMEAPPGLTIKQVESAVRAGINQSNRSSTWAGGSWAVEDSSKPGTIIAGLRNRDHYLQLTITYDERKIRSKITGSQNLRQDDTSIHKNALAWQRRLDSYIYQEVSKLQPADKP